MLGIVLYAVTTTSRWEVDWVTEGMRAVFLEAWDRPLPTPRLPDSATGAGMGGSSRPTRV